MKVLLFLSKGFEHMESSVFIDVFGWARHAFGHRIEVVTCGFTKKVDSTFGVPVMTDTLIDKVNPHEYSAMAIPGGFASFGFYDEAYDEKLSQLIRDFDSMGKPIASVCVGALAIAKSGVLKGRRGTTYHLEGGRWQNQLANFGVQIVKEPVVVDRNIITSYCPETAASVAFQLLEKLTSKKETNLVREAMGYQIN